MGEIKPSRKQIVQDIFELLDNPKTRRKLLDLGTRLLDLIASAYPPAGLWNREPGTRGDGRWYERGYGSRWRRMDGTIGGRRTSERLIESWMTAKEDEYTSQVYTTVSYAPYLFDESKRVGWAKKHGWQTMDEVEDEFTPEFEDIIVDEINKKIDEDR